MSRKILAPAPHELFNRVATLLDERAHDLLRLGVYQLLYMGSVPSYAAINSLTSCTL